MVVTKLLRKFISPKWYIILYWKISDPQVAVLTKAVTHENADTLLIYSTYESAKAMAETLKAGKARLQEVDGEWSMLKGMEYKIVSFTI